MQCHHEFAICQMPVGHGNDVQCLFLCRDCGDEFGPHEGERCINSIGVQMTVRGEILASMRDIQTEVPTEVTLAVGEIFITYGLAEVTLRKLLEQLPGHSPRSHLSEDLSRLEQNLPTILKQTPDVGDLKNAFRNCVKDLRSAFNAVQGKRNTLAHGQMRSVSKTSYTITASGEHLPEEPLGAWCEITHPGYGTVRLTQPEITVVLEAATELRRQVAALVRLVEFRGRRLS